jgi:glutathione-regulated potassium-efflux system ancillary protein KefC
VDQFPIMITAAFVLGFGVRFVGLPPLVGFLLAGFGLNLAGYVSTPELELAADFGVTVLLFSIGLKLRVGTLLRPSVWAGATIHMAVTVVLFGLLLLALPFGAFGTLDLGTAALVAFALSFSSTVFAVKVFEGQGQSASLHAQTAIGILIMQDVVAVIFLAASKGQLPSPWALALLALIPGRYLLRWLMEKSGHGELLLLFGIMMTFAGFGLFELVDLKGDLGALIFGMLVADHPKAKEMAGSLLSFKDLFLVGFFLSIGLRGVPSIPDLGIALLLVALVPFKTALYFGLLTRFHLRARTSMMTSLGLSTYSEFGLIVVALGVSTGWISAQWLVIIAVAVAATFIIAAPVNTAAPTIYDRLRTRLLRYQSDRRLPEERPIYVPHAEVLILGMGRVGTGTYDALVGELGDRVAGVDVDPDAVKRHVEQGRNVVRGDPTDLDFCERVINEGKLRRAMLALPNHRANLVAAAELRSLKRKFNLVVTATAKHDDQVEELEKNGVDAAFNLYAEAGEGYANFVRAALD